jgi:hypothetical protein
LADARKAERCTFFSSWRPALFLPTAERIFDGSHWSNQRQENHMKAAIVRSYERAPEYGDFEEPIAKK